MASGFLLESVRNELNGEARGGVRIRTRDVRACQLQTKRVAALSAAPCENVGTAWFSADAAAWHLNCDLFRRAP